MLRWLFFVLVAISCGKKSDQNTNNSFPKIDRFLQSSNNSTLDESNYSHNQGRTTFVSVRGTLAKSDCWISSAFNILGNSWVPIINKKWKVERNEDNFATHLTEISKLSLRFKSNASGDTEWYSEILDIERNFSVRNFTYFAFDNPLSYQFLDDIRFLAKANVGFDIRILFSPSDCAVSPDDSSAYVGEIGVGEIPFGLVKPVVELPLNMKHAYLHHEVGSHIQVMVDVKFPKVYQNDIASALQKWNSTIGWEVYLPAQIVDNLDAISCLGTQQKLCFFWDGSEDLSWIGWGGLTSMNFDPVTGKILGAIIHLGNIGSSQLTTTPENIKSQMEEGFTLNQLALIHLNKEKFKSYRHPNPNSLVQYLILHEMGHANGLKHDFSGSLTGTPERPSNSVMEYMPFGVSHKLNYIGEKDAERIYLTYNGGSLKNILSGCSDEQESSGKDPNCMKNDIGEPVKWYSILSSKGTKDVFTKVIEPSSSLPERTYADIFSMFLSSSDVTQKQKNEVVDFLCQRSIRGEIQQYLFDKYNQIFSCDSEP